MADIRIKDLPTTASDFSSDDFIAIDGTANGTRKINAKTANLTFSDVTLGTSGPSVKSSLAARAARQGLVFDGTAQASVTLPTIGTADWTFSAWINPTSFAAERAIIGANANTGTDRLGFIVTTGGAINFNSGSTTNLTSTGTIAAGKFSIVTAYRSGNSIFVSINGATPENIGSCASLNITNTSAVIGKWSNNFPLLFLGAISGALIFNRALSATEVVSLYESGVPSGADYNTASNTNAITTIARNSDFSAGATDWASVSGTATVTASKLDIVVSAGGSRVYLDKTFITGWTAGYNKRWRLTADITNYSVSGGAVVQIVQGTTGTTSGTIAGNGTFSVELTNTNGNTANGQEIQIRNTGTTGTATLTIDNVVIVPVGLLLAPDAAQAGGGLVWYDTSGNAANITLPASGVTWNVPTSGYFTAPTTTNLTLAGGSTGASLVLGQGANGNASVAPAGTGSLIVTKNSTGNNVPGIILKNGAAGYTELDLYSGVSDSVKLLLQASDVNSFAAVSVGTNHPLLFGINASEKMRIATTGNLLIGTTTDSGNGKLQLATHTTSAGGIGFGTDTAMFRDTAGGLQQAYSAGTTTRYRLVNNTGNASVFSRTGTTTTISSDDGAVVLASNNTTALTLASNQAATFAGAVTTANKFAVSAYASNSFLTGNCSGFLDNYYNGGSGFDTMSLGVNYDRRNNAISSAIVATGDLRFEQGTGGQSNFVIALGGTNTVPTDRFTIASTGNATFAGAVTVPDSTGLYFGSSARLLWNSGSSSVDVVNTAQSAFLGFRSLTVGVTSTTPSTGAGSGALQVAGGIYAGSASVFGGAVTVNGGLSIPANTFLSIGTFGGATGFKQDTPTTDSIEIWNKGLKVALIGQSQMTMLGAAGGGRFVNFATGTTSASLRWVTGANGTAESGSNAGSDYQIHRYSDAGASLGTAFSITRDTAAATFSGAVTANGQLIAKGTATNDSAATGYIGEYVTATLAYASRVTLATGTAATITSVSLTAGDWDVEGTAAFDLAGVTLTSTTASIGTTGAATGALGEISQNAHSLTTATVQTFQPTPIVRISLSGTTTVYITCNSSFSAGTLKAFGFIRARRVR